MPPARTYLALLVLLAGCGLTSDALDEDGDKDDALDRAALGMARPYVPDPTLRDRDAELKSDMSLRRQVAWERVASFLQPVAKAGCPEAIITDQNREMCERAAEGQLPLWQTWYDRTDTKRIFAALQATGEREFSDAQIDQAFLRDANELIGSEQWPWEDYEKYLETLSDEEAVPGTFEGFRGMRSAYSPQLVAHEFKNYEELRACDQEPSADNPSECLSSEFPIGAAIIKAQWVEVGPAPLPVYDTTGAALRNRLDPASNPGLGWIEADGEAEPTADEIYTIKGVNGKTYRLSSIHLITKELKNWTWITLWWSDTPGSDFGEDRPATITGVWRNYKMAVTVGYEERDPSPEASVSAYPSLADAVQASGNAYDPSLLEGGALPPTWNSNPYLEFPAGAAPTNCIGCHQHAGPEDKSDREILDSVLSGRAAERETFPYDYFFAAVKLFP